MNINEQEIAVLKKYGIKVNSKMALDEVIFLVNQFFIDNPDLSDEEYNELESVGINIMERKYYGESHK